MKYGICTLSVIPLRSEASDKAEMTSQLLFGDLYYVMAEEENWLHIRCAYDAYEGYIASKQHTELSNKDFDKISGNLNHLSFEVVSTAISDQLHIPVLLGSSLPFFDGLSFKVIRNKFVFNGRVLNGEKAGDLGQVKKIASKYLNAPYLWGGKSPFGIDCSGLTQMVFKLAGIQLPRDAYLQAQNGKTINLISESQSGDLAFFDNKEGKITHVGIIVDGGEIIHASGKVRLDKIDHYGIFNTETNKYTHKLRIIKRFS